MSKGRFKYILAAALIVAHSFVSLIPFNNTYAIDLFDINLYNYTGEEKVKKFLYALRMYNCFNEIENDQVALKMTDKNLHMDVNNISPSKIYATLVDYTPETEDTWLGWISCKDAINGIFGENNTITQDMIEYGGLLYGAYREKVSSNQAIKCSYKIWNDNKSSYLYFDKSGKPLFRKQLEGKGEYDLDYDDFETDDDYIARSIIDGDSTTAYWPQSLVQPNGYDELKSRGDWVILDMVEVDYILPGHRLTFNYADGELSSIETSSARYGSVDEVGSITYAGLKYKEDWFYYFYWSEANEDNVCEDLVNHADESWQSIEFLDWNHWYDGPFLYREHNPQGTTLMPMITDDVFGIDTDTVNYVRGQQQSNGSLELIQDAGSSHQGAGKVIAENIKEAFFDGLDPEKYLEENKDLAYTLYGRYIFNGDSMFPYGCNGISIKSDDSRLQELINNKFYHWDSSVYKTEAYEGSDSTSKTEFTTKIGAKTTSGTGEDLEVSIYAGAPRIKCSELIKKFNGLTLGMYPDEKDVVYDYISPITVESILGSSSEDPPEDPPTDPPEDPPADPPEPTIEADPEDTCYDNAGSLGWILCPIIVGLQEVILETYAKWVVPALQVDARLFHAGKETDATYQAWDIFRQIANYLFIVVFIFVIFSQVSGIGIEKYGIKRLLPKLFVCAVLINLSFLICQIAIDVGNIVGNGIGGLFGTITNAITPPDSVIVEGVEVGSMAWDSFMSSGWNVALVIIVAILGVAAVLTQGLAIIIPVAMAFLSILISIITLIAILGMRQAAIVLLVVSSPIAFLCYMLPNTKSIFNKWANAFKTMLITFPICSALIYGGNMASMILLNASSGNTWLIIAAAAIGIAPIFVIPKVIKTCMGAISIGMARFSNKMGGKAKGAANRRMENSFLTRRRNYNQQMRNQKAAMRSSSYNAKRGKKVLNRYNNDPSKLNRFQKRKYYAARGAVNANSQEMESAYSSGYANQTDGEIIGALNSAAKNGNLNSNMLVSGLKNIKNEKQLASTLKSLSGTKAYQDLMKNDPTVRERISSSMRGRNGVISQSIGKVMNTKDSNGNYRTDVGKMFSDGTLRDEVRRAGTGVMASQSYDVFDTEGAEDLFSDEQLREASISGYSGATAASFHEMMTGTKMDASGHKVDRVSESRKANIISGLTAANATKLRVEKDESGNNIGSFHALGGASLINKYNPSLATTLNSSAGDKLRGDMQTEVKNELGVKHD